MRRTPLLIPLAVVAFCAPAAAQDRPPLKAVLAACGSGPTDADRFAVFTASMPGLAGTERMALRFDLFTRADDARAWERVTTRGFGRWQRSLPGRGGYVATKRVERLEQATSYRVVVRFRWYAAGSVVQRTAMRRAPACHQPDQRPDLRIESIGVTAGPDASTDRYAISILNAGLTAAAPFDVGLSNGHAEAVRSVAGLAAGERTTVEVVAPRCEAGDQIVAQADVGGAVDESDERDNRFIRLCSGR